MTVTFRWLNPSSLTGVNHDRSHDRRYLLTVRALAARHGLVYGPLTVNELGLDYRIVIATVDDGRRWVLRIPRRAEVSAKVEPEARVLAMLKNRPCRSRPDWRVLQRRACWPIPCSKTRLRWSSAWFVHARLGRAAAPWEVSRGELRDCARRPACRLISAARDADVITVHPTRGPSKVLLDDVDRVRRESGVHVFPPVAALARRRFVVHRFLRGGAWRSHVAIKLIDNTERVSG